MTLPIVDVPGGKRRYIIRIFFPFAVYFEDRKSQSAAGQGLVQKPDRYGEPYKGKDLDEV